MTVGDQFHDFWEASTLNSLNFSAFAARVLAFDLEPEIVDPLAQSEAAHPLPLKRDRLQRQLEARRSGREFSAASLSEKALGQILAAVTETSPNQRLYPSAGGVDCVEVFALLHRVESKLGRRAARYIPAQHSLQPVRAELPDAAELDRLCSLEGSAPPLVLIFAIKEPAMLAKYGERGGRFALMEIGHACQNIALRLSADGLVGYQLGGVLDGDLEQLLDIGPGRAKVTLGYAIGHPG